MNLRKILKNTLPIQLLYCLIRMLYHHKKALPFLTIIINTANVIGIVKAAKFPDNSPGDREFPTINKTPDIAKIIEINVIELIFSFKKKKPNIAKNKIWSELFHTFLP